MKDLKRFATSDWPLHPSGLATLLTCPWRMVGMYLFEPSDEHGPAGDTGSAMHVAVRDFHRGHSIVDSIKVMGEERAKYPLADLADAANMFLKYVADPRNANADVILTEQDIKFQITPAPEDPTKEAIQIIGRIDQVRRMTGVLNVLDLKTSKRDPMELMGAYAVQLAAYTVGATIHLGQTVNGAGIILPRLYPRNVFWSYPWTLKDCEHILNGVRHMVARVRSSDVWHNANPDCKWCMFKSPDLCLPRLKDALPAIRQQLTVIE